MPMMDWMEGPGAGMVFDEVWNLIGDMTMEGGAMGGVAVVVASRVLSITSAMRLRVELRVLEMITGFKSLVLLFDVCLELGGHTLLALFAFLASSITDTTSTSGNRIC